MLEAESMTAERSRGRSSSSMGMVGNQPSTSAVLPRSSPPPPPRRVAAQQRIGTGQRLRAAASFTPRHPPSCMAVRRTGVTASAGGIGRGRSLAAVAGPTGITVVDVMAPQRPWLVLNYSSSPSTVESSYPSRGRNGSGGICGGGITTMAFQPCPSTLSDSYGGGGIGGYSDGCHSQSPSAPILLATARGSGILIWDCSGRALSPLLGRLNASDSSSLWGGATVSNVGGGGDKRNNNNSDGTDSDEGGGANATVLPAGADATTSNAPAAVQKDAAKPAIFSPLGLDRKSSAVSVSSSSSLLTSTNNAVNSNPSAAASSGTRITASGSSSRRDITSLDWKGPSSPVLLSTCGGSACVWDLRTSLLSAAGGGAGAAGARPNARFVSPRDELSADAGGGGGGATLIHCAYSLDESAHAFATLDSAGVVRVWDDRKADRPRRSFLACPGGGVGIAPMAPPIAETGAPDSGQRWMTWGMDDGDDDDGQSYNDDLVVKVWTESSVTPKSRKNTSSTVSTPDEHGGEASTRYEVTSRISMAGGVAARLHPSFVDGILLFRDRPLERENDDLLGRQSEAAGLLSTPPPFRLGASAGKMDEGGGVEGVLVKSPVDQMTRDRMFLATGLKMRASPEMAMVQTPPSPPPLTLEENVAGDPRRREAETPPSSGVHQGWEAELWCIDGDESPEHSCDSVGVEEAKEVSNSGECQGARRAATFRGGGAEEDALSFAPGRGGASGVVAVDLALCPPAPDGGADPISRREELSLCVLDEEGRMTVYGVPEASSLVRRDGPAEAAPPRRGTDAIPEPGAYRQGAGGGRHSLWWKKNKEDDLFADGGGDAGRRESPKKSPAEAMRAAVEGAGDPPGAPAPPKFDVDLKPNIAGVRGGGGASSRIPEHADEKPHDGLSPHAADSIQGSIIPSVDLVASMDEVEREGVDASATGDVQNSNLPIDPVAAARVPCPPLCGAAFSGVGGLVTFSNGPVKRMWSHYQSNESMSPNNEGPGNFGRFSFHSHAKKGSDIISREEDTSVQDLGPSSAEDETRAAVDQALPRTMADLIEMNLRSQSLQWGDNEPQEDTPRDHDDDGSSSGGGSSSYEDGDLDALASDDSSRISDSDDSDGFYRVPSGDSPRRGSLDAMIDDYFSLSRKSEHQDGAGGPGDENFAGLPSLSPSVAITRDYDDILLNCQTPELANALELGDCWWLKNNFAVPVSRWQGGGVDKYPSSSAGSIDETEFKRNISDPHLISPFSRRKIHRSASFSSTPESKYTKDTSMMGSLKKLFAHQLPNALTPPDQRLLNSKSKQRSSQVSGSKKKSGVRPNNCQESNSLPFGVYALENPQTPEAASERLAIAHELCIHNARICSDHGQKSKADTWILLSQTIESIFTFELDETDGWGGDDDALTTGVVEQIMRYYEVQGDFQMLSTILCVLLFGRDRRSSSRDSAKGRYQLLPKFDQCRYDNYLHRYAALLYGWGVLTVRSEISKRLAYNTPGAGAEMITQPEMNRGKCRLIPNSGVAPGVTFAPFCMRCMEPVTDPTYVCQKCNEYAFQCSICCSAVRGACTWCPLCGHGGHLDHMMQWFQGQKVCPTGCGCICMINPTHLGTNY